MIAKQFPISEQKLKDILSVYPTPFHIYDEKAIRENARRIKKAFEWCEGFTNFYAVKALPNPFILKILKAEGFGCDCSSYTELLLSQKVGITGEQIIFTSNDTPAHEFKKAIELGAIINLDDITHIPYLEQHTGLPELICLRYNPGPLKKGNPIIGHPEEAKYGFTREQLLQGYKMLKEKGVKRFGLHTMVASNELNPYYFIETVHLLFDLCVDIYKKFGIRMEFVNMGGGFGIPYKPEDKPVDLELVSKGIRELYEKMIRVNNLHPLRIVMESGRMITGPYGWLVSKVLHVKKTYKNYAGLDASMHNLMRPALYGAYHHITVVGKENDPHTAVYDVTGSLCENNDKFAINRPLPPVEPGDIIIIHDTGAHGYAMGFNYNGKLRSAELLLRSDGSVLQIRRPETPDDYFSTLDFEAAGKFNP